MQPVVPVLHVGRGLVGRVRSVKAGVLQRLEGVFQGRQLLQLGLVLLVFVRNILDDGRTNFSLPALPDGQRFPDVMLPSD